MQISARAGRVAAAFSLVFAGALAVGFEQPASAANSVRGVTATSITVGGVGQEQIFTGMATGAMARFAQINKTGGIDGRKIKFVGMKTDGSSSQTDLSAVQALVQDTHVFAVVPATSTSLLPASTNYLKQNKVPFVGWGFMPGYCGNAFGYGFNGCLIGTSSVNGALVDPVLAALKKTDHISGSAVKAAIQTGNTVTGVSGAKQYAQVLTQSGAKVVYNEANLPSNTTTYGPFASAIVATSPNLVYASVEFTQVIGMAAALRQDGYKGPIVNFVTYVPGLLTSSPQTASALQGVWVDSQFPPVATPTPAIKALKAGLTLIGDKATTITQGDEIGYFAADLLVQQLHAAGKKLTPATFQKAMKSFKYTPLTGGLGPVTFPADHTEATPCAAVVAITGQQYKTLEPMTCYKDIPATG